MIAPGLFETEFNRALIDKPEIYSAVKEKVPLKRWGQPGDIAPVMVYLSSNAGRYVNGHVFTVDGGILAAL